jgi:GTP cyclohydrolase I
MSKKKTVLDHTKIEAGVSLMLEGLHVDTKDRNYVGTPGRFARLLEEMFVPPKKKFPVFTECYDGIVLIKNHTLYTLCPHHLLPVKLRISMAYAPRGRVIGISKLPRMAHDLNRQPLLQEDLTTQLVTLLSHIPKNAGSAVFIEGDHLCMQMRGIKSGASTVTFASRGIFQDPLVWANFLRMISS